MPIRQDQAWPYLKFDILLIRCWNVEFPTQKKGEKVWTNFSPFLSPDLVILQNLHQILWLIFWLNHYCICPRNVSQISSQFISPYSVTPKNHHRICWKVFHNIFRYSWFKKKLTKIVTIFVTKFGDSQNPITKFGEKIAPF